jgi:hypothetical protein
MSIIHTAVSIVLSGKYRISVETTLQRRPDDDGSDDGSMHRSAVPHRYLRRITGKTTVRSSFRRSGRPVHDARADCPDTARVIEVQPMRRQSMSNGRKLLKLTTCLTVTAFISAGLAYAQSSGTGRSAPSNTLLSPSNPTCSPGVPGCTKNYPTSDFSKDNPALPQDSAAEQSGTTNLSCIPGTPGCNPTDQKGAATPQK